MNDTNERKAQLRLEIQRLEAAMRRIKREASEDMMQSFRDAVDKRRTELIGLNLQTEENVT
jgi:hypothetical protein